MTMRRYSLALFAALVSVAVHLAIAPVIGLQLPYLVFGASIAVVAVMLGRGPAFVVLAAGILNAFVFLPLVAGTELGGSGVEASSAVFILVGIFLIIGGGAIRDSRLSLIRRLQESDKRKDMFLAVLAHELRNPLAPIQLAVEILRSPQLDPSRRKAFLDVLERQTATLTRLLDDLLDISRIVHGKLHLDRTLCRLSDITRTALETTAPMIESRRHRLTILVPDDIWIWADAVRLSQVFSNLLANAAKYTPEEGEIAVQAWRDERGVHIQVRDNGIGIRSERLTNIFDALSGGGDAAGGLGLGLAIAKGLVEMHAGSIRAESAGLGEGCAFIIDLPASMLSAPPESETPQEPAAGVSPARIVVADDNRDAADLVAELLRGDGHEVHVVYDGEAALKSIVEVEPDVAILDIGMPVMTGNEVARAVRARPGLAATRLIALTGWGQAADRAQTAASGFDMHLTKPVSQPELQKAIAHAGSPADRLAREKAVAGRRHSR